MKEKANPNRKPCEAGLIGETPLIDVKEAARILGVAPRTVTRMCADGAIKAVKVRSLWRINRAALLAFAGVVEPEVAEGGERVG